MRRCNSDITPAAAPTFLQVADFAIAPFGFAIAVVFAAVHKDYAFQASSPKLQGWLFRAGPFFASCFFAFVKEPDRKRRVPYGQIGERMRMAPYKRSSLVRHRGVRGASRTATVTEQHGAYTPAGRAESQVIDGLVRAVPLATGLWIGLATMVTLIF